MKNLVHQPDYGLIISFFLILIFGLVMLSSATSVLGYDKFQDSYWYFKHQLLNGFLPGLVLFFLFSRIDYRKWKNFSGLFFIFSIVFLIAVFIPGLGASYGKARSWINIFGYSLQPSELVKFTFLIFLSAWLDKNRDNITSATKGLLPFLFYLGLVSGLIIAQPDTGTMFIILIISLIVYYLAGARIKHLILVLIAGIGGLAGLVAVASYRMQRIAAFFDSNIDPQGIGYHIKQALVAVGSGGWFGLGLGHSRQKFQYLPEVAGDSIFAIMAEELGFVAMVLVLVLFLFLFYRIIKISLSAPDIFGKLLGAGVGVWIISQFFVNIGAMIKLLPLTGLPLPLVSYGGTAMAALMAAIGLVVNISRYNNVNASRRFRNIIHRKVKI